MKCRTVIYTEGKSELIFIYNLLFKIFSADKFTVKTLELLTSDNFKPSSQPDHVMPYADYEFLIMSVEGGERVMSEIKQNANSMLNKGFYYICGLKDMYCQRYDQLSSGKIDINTTNKFVQDHQSELAPLNNSSKIIVFFAVMELEAWYLCFIKALNKIGLTENKINPILKSKINKTLDEIDPEVLFFKPSKILKDIYKQLENKNYDKVSFSYKLCKYLDLDDINAIYSKNRLLYFRKFYDFLKSLQAVTTN